MAYVAVARKIEEANLARSEIAASAAMIEAEGKCEAAYFLTSLPLWELIALVVVLPTMAAMVAQTFIHKQVPIDRLVQNNELAGFKFATVGVIYAVLLGFTVIVAWEKFSAAEGAVDQEAAAIASLFRYADGKEPQAVALREALVKYADSAIRDEWPEMGRESESLPPTHALESVYEAAIALGRAESRDTADMAEVFTQLDSVTASRRVRLHLATGLVPGVVWIALFAGAALTVGFTLFFGSKNLAAQVAMTGILSVLVTLGLVVIVSIDHPFSGPVRVHPDPLLAVLGEIGGARPLHEGEAALPAQ